MHSFARFPLAKLQGLGGKPVAATVIRCASSLCLLVGVLVFAQPAQAHHPFGSEAPQTLLAGFLSGLGHPVIGLDHLAFIIAIGLVAAAQGRRGRWLPWAFVIATVAGTGMHLARWNLPAVELGITLSVAGFGLILALGRRMNGWGLLILVALAGLFHGFAYGEGVIGAEMTPTLAYLIGFAGVQGAIATGTRLIARQLLQPLQTTNPDLAASGLSLRFAGFTLLGIGAAFVSGVVLG
jgi:urease accessory protein